MITLALAMTVTAACPTQDADIGILQAVNGWHAPVGDVAARVASNEVLLVGLAPAAGYALTRDWRTPARVAGAEVLGGVVGLGLKVAFDRPRPFVTYPGLRLPAGPERTASFPSGHAAVSFAGATALALEQPAVAAPAYLWAGLVCYSRMYNGVHYPTDLLAGSLVGIGSAFLVHAVAGSQAGPPQALILPWQTTF